MMAKKRDDEGYISDRLGAVFQAFMAEQMGAALYTRGAVKGSVTLTFPFTSGPDGSPR